MDTIQYKELKTVKWENKKESYKHGTTGVFHD